MAPAESRTESLDGRPVAVWFISAALTRGQNANTVAFQFFLNQAAERRVDCRQHRVRSAKKRNVKTALGQSVGHLKAYVARADEDCCSRISLGQVSMDRETVIHRMQQKHTLVFASGEIGSDRLGAGRDDQAIIAHRHLRSGVYT